MKTINLIILSFMLSFVSFTASAVEVTDYSIFIEYKFKKYKDGFNLIVYKGTRGEKVVRMTNYSKKAMLCTLNGTKIQVPAVQDVEYDKFPEGNIEDIKCLN